MTLPACLRPEKNLHHIGLIYIITSKVPASFDLPLKNRRHQILHEHLTGSSYPMLIRLDASKQHCLYLQSSPIYSLLSLYCSFHSNAPKQHYLIYYLQSSPNYTALSTTETFLKNN
uniref:Uncharacterized protein n=1 Tax=Cacopsylla melanoneura TaxID=428564 RepID=A0A8D8LJ03_9HEMI